MRHALPLIWRRSTERYNLIGCFCENCKTTYFPTRTVCPKCRRAGKLVDKQMPDEGEIISYTEVHSGPKGFEHETPYYMAIVQFDNGARLITQVVDSPEEKIIIGAKVKKVFRKIFEDNDEGAIAYGYKFKIA